MVVVKAGLVAILLPSQTLCHKKHTGKTFNQDMLYSQQLHILTHTYLIRYKLQTTKNSVGTVLMDHSKHLGKKKNCCIGVT